MGTYDDIDLERAAPRPDPVELSQMVRDEVRAALREQMMGSSSSEPAPPSYDSAASLLAPEVATVPNEQSDGESSPQESSSKVSAPSCLCGAMVWLAPTAVVMSIPMTAWYGIDPLGLAPVSLMLLVGSWIIIGIATAISEKQKPAEEQPTKEADDDSTQQQQQQQEEGAPQTDQKPADNPAPFMSFIWTATYLLFILVMWLWFTKRNGSLFAASQTAARFDAKVGVDDALSKLTECLEDAVQGRKVLAADISQCLAKMGLKSVSDIQITHVVSSD